MAGAKANPGHEQMRRWVETWRKAGPELEAIRRREIENIDTATAIRQLFGADPPPQDDTRRTTSGLVEQQALFAKLRR